MSNFDNVSLLNIAYGNIKGDPMNPNWDKIKSQAENIKDEFDELMEAITNKDIQEVRDAIGDILVFTYGVGHIAGVPVDADMHAIDVSNRSKFCANPSELAKTIAKYNSKGIDVTYDGEYPFVRVRTTHQQTDHEGKNYPANKVLKGVNFKEPVFIPLTLDLELV